MYALNAAEDQKNALNEKVEIALDVIVDKVSANQSVCKTVDNCLHQDNKPVCCKFLDGEKEWQTIDSIIKSELERFKIDLNYNFDFCKYQPEDQNTYAMKMDKVFSEAGVVMYLEFPDRSMYLFRQMGPVFISSILLILFITIAYVLTYRYYKRERKLVSRTRDFINNMTHEFKTPLSNILFASNMINRENEQVRSDKIERYTSIIQDENQRLIDNCEDLLMIGAAENTLEQALFENVDVHDALKSVAERYQAMQEIEVNLTLDLNANQTVVMGKLSFIDNLFSNLVDNAIKYSATSPKITIVSKNEGNLLVVEVRDEGIGISKEATKAIFDKFYRVNNQNQHDVKGFGLGLSYVKMVVKQMKGSVEVESELGKGSVFRIKLPLTNG